MVKNINRNIEKAKENNSSVFEELYHCTKPKYMRIYDENEKLMDLERDIKKENKDDGFLLNYFQKFLIKNFITKYYRELQLRDDYGILYSWDDVKQEVYLAFLSFIEKYRNERGILHYSIRKNRLLVYRNDKMGIGFDVTYFLLRMRRSIEDHFNQLFRKIEKTVLINNNENIEKSENSYFENKCTDKIFLDMYREKLKKMIENESTQHKVIGIYDLMRLGFSLKEIAEELGISYRYAKKLYGEYIKNSGKRDILETRNV